MVVNGSLAESEQVAALGVKTSWQERERPEACDMGWDGTSDAHREGAMEW